MSELKKCSLCDGEFPLQQFRVINRAKGWRTSHCRECANAYLRKWRQDHADKLLQERRARYERETEEDRERRRADQRAAYAADPAHFRNKILRSQFGITIQQYDDMRATQGGFCAICRQECTSGRQLAVDHDHTTGAVRGLLCGNCNRGLGFFQDNPEILQAALSYLQKWSDHGVVQRTEGASSGGSGACGVEAV